MAQPAKLTFVGYEISKFHFEKPLNYLSGAFSVDLHHDNKTTTATHDVDDIIREIASEISITLTDPDEPDFSLNVQVFGFFEITGDIEDKILANYLDISIPSILYPYVRAFITNLVVQTGMEPIILPPLNFGYKPNPETETKAP